jgi:hypothetical protein
MWSHSRIDDGNEVSHLLVNDDEAPPHYGKIIIIGDCPDCIKKQGNDCPVVLTVREQELIQSGSLSIRDRERCLVRPKEEDGDPDDGRSRGMPKSHKASSKQYI